MSASRKRRPRDQRMRPSAPRDHGGARARTRDATSPAPAAQAARPNAAAASNAAPPLTSTPAPRSSNSPAKAVPDLAGLSDRTLDHPLGRTHAPPQHRLLAAGHAATADQPRPAAPARIDRTRRPRLGVGRPSPPSPTRSTPRNNAPDSPTRSSASATNTDSTPAKPPTRSWNSAPHQPDSSAPACSKPSPSPSASAAPLTASTSPPNPSRLIRRK